MATEFRVTVIHPDRRYARQAINAAFVELDHLESLLSRFIPSSDIARLNRLPANGRLVVAPETYDCLRTALAVERQTGGAFNIAYGSTPRRAASRAIVLDPTVPAVRIRTAGARLDLGGIGKGFALDQVAALVQQWDIGNMLFEASASTFLACRPPPGEQGWPVRIGRGEHQTRIVLAEAALSGSGSEVKGRHIIDPRTGRPATVRDQVWARAPTAARADALSTAFMVMTDKAIRTCCSCHRDATAYIEVAGRGPLRVGPEEK